MNKDKIIYWGSTGLLSLMMLASASMYFLKYDEVSKVFGDLGFPTFIIYPLAVAKILGVIAILTKKSVFLKNLAYAGFFYDFVLAFGAHIAVADGEAAGAVVALVLLALSYFFEDKALADD